jgi:membrane-bound lytic murein transglycosylase B
MNYHRCTSSAYSTCRTPLRIGGLFGAKFYSFLFALLFLLPTTIFAVDSPQQPASKENSTANRDKKDSSASSSIVELQSVVTLGDGQAPTNTKVEKKKPATKLRGNFRGWEYLVTKLHEDNVSPHELRKTYGSTRMPRFENVPFSVNPKESKRLYKSFTDASRLKVARAYLKKHKTAFQKAENHFKVSKFVVAAIIYVETQCGRVTGTELIVNRLSRVATIAKPSNVKANYLRLLKDGENVTFAEVEERGKYLEEMFYPEIPSLFEIARRNKINIFGIRGSYAGAFGIPQFLPSTYLKFGVDANKDGRVSLFQDLDAIWSTANFLSSFGWKPSLTDDEKKKVIWRYNHSDAYVDTILEVAKKLKGTK